MFIYFIFMYMGSKISSTSGDEREGAASFCREFRCWCNATALSCYWFFCINV